jgi:hypothetical protein
MGLHPSTLQSSIPDAYRAMRMQYLRLPPESRRRSDLLRLLDESYAVLNDAEKRALYDQGAGKAAATVVEEEPKEIEPILIHDEESRKAVRIGASDQAAGSSTEEAEDVDVEPVIAPVEAEVEEVMSVQEEAPVVEEAPVAPPPATVPDPAPSQAGRLKRTKSRELTMDDLKPPEPVFSPARPRKAKVEGDVEAVLLGRLAARMDELAAFGEAVEKSEE